MREWFRQAAFIARTDLWFMLRQRETLLWVFAMPLLFFYFIGTVTSGFSGSGDRRDPLALQTSAPQGVVLDAIVRRLEARNFRIDRPATPEALESYSRRLVIPSFTDDSVAAGTAVPSVLELRGNGVGAEQLDQFRVASALYTVVADLAVLKSTGQPVTAATLSALASAP